MFVFSASQPQNHPEKWYLWWLTNHQLTLVIAIILCFEMVQHEEHHSAHPHYNALNEKRLTVFASVFMSGCCVPCSTSAEHWEGFTAGTVAVWRWWHWDLISLCGGGMPRVSFPLLSHKKTQATDTSHCSVSKLAQFLCNFFIFYSDLNKPLSLLNVTCPNPLLLRT